MFTSTEKQIMGLLAILIAEYPAELVALLSVYDVKVNSEEEIIDAVYQKIEEGDTEFQSDLAQLIYLHYEPFKLDHFTGSTPMDPVSAIAGAVGSIGNVFNQSLRNKQFKQEARTQTFSDVLAYKSLKHQLAAEQVRREQVSRNQKTWLQVAVLALIGGIGTWLLLKK
jgi:hypothetical protein